MAQQSSGCGTGCALLLALPLLALAIAFWPVVLATLLIAVIVVLVLQHNRRQLQAMLKAAERRFSNDPCQVRGQFGVIDTISLAGELHTPRIDIRCRTLGATAAEQPAEPLCISLSPPAQQVQLRSPAGVIRWLRSGGIEPLDSLSVEAKAVTAAFECLRELAWARQALVKLDQLHHSVRDTLAKAQGNELLEAAIPQLQRAQQTFANERDIIQQAERSAADMLRKLHDFLSVPKGLRPILNLDLDPLTDRRRFADLERSFSEVVQLNDIFRQLSANDGS